MSQSVLSKWGVSLTDQRFVCQWKPDPFDHIRHQVPRVSGFDRATAVLAVALGWVVDCPHTNGGCSFLSTSWCCVCLSPALWCLSVPCWLVRVLPPALEVTSWSFWRLPGEPCPCLTACVKLACPALGLLSHEAEDTCPFGEVCGTGE